MFVTPTDLARHVQDKNRTFLPGDIDKALAALHNLFRQGQPAQFCALRGKFDHSISLALLNDILPVAAPAVYDRFNNNGTVLIPHVEPCGRGRVLNFEPVEEKSGYSVVEFSIPGNFMRVEYLPTIAPPEVNPDKGVVLRITRGPTWMSGTLALAYRKYPWVGIEVPDKYAVVCLRNRANAPLLGTNVYGRPQPTGDNRPEPGPSFGPPKRGEVWFFNSEFGPHPCVIMSHGSSGQPGSNKVSIIPFTSSVDKHVPKPGFAVLVPAGTGGLDKDSVALCHELQSISRDRLTGPALGMLSPELLQMLVLNHQHWLKETVGG